MKVRFHRGGLSDSLKTQFEPKDWKDFCAQCLKDDELIIIDSIKCELYSNEPDYRIDDWNKTYILLAKFTYSKDEFYPFAFSNEDIFKLKNKGDKSD